jgi:hypothetical protein
MDDEQESPKYDRKRFNIRNPLFLAHYYNLNQQLL